MRLQLASKEDTDITTMLNEGEWGDPESPPENLPEHMINPDKRLLSLRAQIISERKIDECKLCNQQGTQELTHLFSECTQPLKVLQRQAYWNGIKTYNQSLHDYMSKLEPN